ncbi:MAG: hypothetical protein AAFO29_15295 [Actinomycetota bacterium]
MQLTDGEFHPASWVYVWTRPGGEVLYVGATGLPLAARVWLHANDERPEVGRVRAHRPDALTGDVIVRGFPVPPELDRGAVRQCLEAMLAQPLQIDRSDFDDAVVAEATRIHEALGLAP